MNHNLEQPKPQEGHPFKGELEDKYASGKIKSIEDIPGKVVREINLSNFINMREHPKQFYPHELKRGELLSEVVESKKEFELLQELGVHTSLDIVLGKNKHGNDSVFLVTDDIDGIDAHKLFSIFDEENTIPEEEKSALKEDALVLVYALFQYFKGKIYRDEHKLWDIFNPRQYVWGTKKGEKNKHLYLVDIEPLTTKTEVFTKNMLEDFSRMIYFVSKEFDVDLSEIKDWIRKHRRYI